MKFNLKPDSEFSRKCIAHINRGKDRDFALAMESLNCLEEFSPRKMPPAPQCVLQFNQYKKTDAWENMKKEERGRAYGKLRKNEDYAKWTENQQKVEMANYSNVLWIGKCLDVLVARKMRDAALEFVKVYDKYPKKTSIYERREYYV